jgi:hypothetical protein
MATITGKDISRLVRAQAANGARYQSDKEGNSSFSRYVLTQGDDKMIAMYSDKAVAAVKALIYTAVTIECANSTYTFNYTNSTAKRRYDDVVMQSTMTQYIINYVLASFAAAQQNSAAYQYYTGLSNEDKAQLIKQIHSKKEVDDDTD